MTQQERKQAARDLSEAYEEAEIKTVAIIDKAQGTRSKLYDKKRKGEVKINVVDALNLDLYYEQILRAKYCISNMPHFAGGMAEDGTEEEFAFVFQRLNDLMETAKSNFEKIKYLTSKLD